MARAQRRRREGDDGVHARPLQHSAGDPPVTLTVSLPTASASFFPRGAAVSTLWDSVGPTPHPDPTQDDLLACRQCPLQLFLSSTHTFAFAPLVLDKFELE